MWSEITLLLLAVFLACLPTLKLVYGLLWPDSQHFSYGRSAYAFWQLKKHLAFALFTLCEAMKPIFTFSIALLLQKDDILALHLAFVVVLLQLLSASQFKRPFKVKLWQNITPLFAYYVLLTPLGALLALLFYAGCALTSKRVHFSAISTLFVAPVFLMLTVNFDLPYIWGIILPVLYLLAYKKELLGAYPFKERPNL